MVMQETSSENCTLICQPLQSLQEFEVYNTKKYAQLILNFFWVVYKISSQISLIGRLRKFQKTKWMDINLSDR